MVETPAHSPLEGRRRRLLFRASHRGTRENDFLVGGFVAPRLAGFSESEIDVLEAIMELPDPILTDWLTGRRPMPSEHDSAEDDLARLVPMLRAMYEARGRGPLG